MYEEMKMVLNDMGYFEKVAQKIVFLLQNPDLYKGKMTQIVHIPVMNLVMLFGVPYQVDGQMKHIIITNQMLMQWKITVEQLCEVAYANTRRLRPLQICSLSDLLHKIAKENMGEHYDRDFVDTLLGDESPELYVISNMKGVYGASSLFYEGAIKACSEALDSDLVLLPSSVHEWLCCRHNLESRIAELCKMVYDINRQEVAVEDRLSDTVYIYHRKEDILECVETGERLKLSFESVKRLLADLEKVAC